MNNDNEEQLTDAGAVDNAAGVGNLEQVLAENERLRSELRVREARDVLTRALAGAASPGLLFEAAKEMLQFDDEGKLANAAAIVAELKGRFPEQFRPASIGGGSGTTVPVPALTKEALAQMSPAEIARMDWAVVRQVLSSES